MIAKLLKLQESIYQYHKDIEPRFLFSKGGKYMDVLFYGDGYDEKPQLKAEKFGEYYNFGFCALLDFLSIQENANNIRSLKFDGPDTGANGIKEWNFTRLLNSSVTFPNLKEFEVAFTDLGNHNLSLIDNGQFSEAGISKLLSKIPNLETLILPSAPDSSFFNVKNKLAELKIQAGCDHQNFIENLANSNNFKHLNALDYSEKFDHFNDFTSEDYTSFESFKKLFKSSVVKKSESRFHFTLRNSNLTTDQLFELQSIKDIQFLYVQCKPGQYVNHLKENYKPKK